MGKIKRNRTRVLDTPLGVVQAEQAKKLISDTIHKPLALLEKLEDISTIQREWACCSIAHLIEEPKSLEDFLRHDVVSKLLKRACDTDLEVKLAALGALRNLSVLGGDNVCTELLQKDCFTPLIHTLKTTVNDPQKSNTGMSVLVQTISIFWSLCEVSNKAISILKQNELLPILFSLLNPLVFSQEVMICTAQLLNVITEENSFAQLITNEQANILKNIVSVDGNILLRNLSASIIMNITPPNQIFSNFETILPILSSSLDIDVFIAFRELEPLIEKIVYDSAIERSVIPENVEEKFNAWKTVVDAQILCLEILANFSSNDDQDESEFIEMDENMRFDEDQVMDPQTNKPMSEELKLIISSGLFNKICAKCVFPVAQIYQLEAKFTSIKFYLRSFYVLQERALGCMSNMLLSSDLSALGDVSRLWNLFTEVCVQLANIPQLVEPLEFGSNIMWTLLRHDSSHQIFDVTPNHVQFISELSKQRASDQVRANALGMLGVIGQKRSLASFLPSIGVRFMESLSDDSGLVIAEALNSIFDIFAEEEFNAIVKELNMVNVLESFVPSLKNMISTRRDLDKALLDRLDETKINLLRFIDYKKGQSL